MLKRAALAVFCVGQCMLLAHGNTLPESFIKRPKAKVESTSTLRTQAAVAVGPSGEISQVNPQKAAPVESNVRMEEHNVSALGDWHNPLGWFTATRYVQDLVPQDGGAYYLSELCFGSNGQCFLGILDTGSFELVVRSAKCNHHGCKEPFYKAIDSQSYEEQKDSTLTITYGSGPVTCSGAFDQVSIDRASPLKVSGQFFEEVISSKVQGLGQGSIVGIWGIGPGDEDGRNSRFVSRLGIVRYSVCMATNETENGQLIWNDDDPKDNALFQVVPIFGKYHWATGLTNMRLSHPPDHKSGKKKNLLLGCASGCGTILDSGTTFIVPPEEVVMSLTKYLFTRKLTCNNFEELPNLEFELEGGKYILPPAAYVSTVQVAELPDFLMDRMQFMPPDLNMLTTCMFMFMKPMGQKTQKGPAMILGMPFFRYYYTTFDFKNTVAYTARHTKCRTEKDVQTDDYQTNFMQRPMHLDLSQVLHREYENMVVHGMI